MNQLGTQTHKIREKREFQRANGVPGEAMGAQAEVTGDASFPSHAARLPTALAAPQALASRPCVPFSHIAKEFPNV